MILCPRCLKKIDKDIHDFEELKCPSCRQIIHKKDAIPTIKFLDCISQIRFVGVNSEEDAKQLLEMMK